MEKAVPFRSGTILSNAVLGEFLGTVVLILLSGVLGALAFKALSSFSP